MSPASSGRFEEKDTDLVLLAEIPLGAGAVDIQILCQNDSVFRCYLGNPFLVGGPRSNSSVHQITETFSEGLAFWNSLMPEAIRWEKFSSK